MSSVVDGLLASLPAESAGMVSAALRALDLEGDGNPDAAIAYALIETIARQSIPLSLKLERMLALLEIEGPVTVNRSCI